MLELEVLASRACSKFILGFQLSFPGVESLYNDHSLRGSGQIWLDDVQCHGTEARLDDCQANPFGFHNCKHNEDVAVACAPLGTVKMVKWLLWSIVATNCNGRHGKSFVVLQG